ncbi:uncharacterized protein SPPG_02840 [Spizellomyces punctatus DAOM BR117]|uniref:Uncharacterized protein n=1 Tax=Spizellomyces punctatus (strain DAOM BR117) TaxID=645134 RepID=A0A0L0HN61_SPIPD|nr:uncharacterized protein SPPG_02840 [Spizellomyces punctatus DAOM BR117]KND02370.1 hypothetical protein SPPG_02840 [Spizellomyces punctatus DAOM BR117]|eukprot:XP_016610409.1 hypothetical protein SPPG_02840 [Spizellomyces punctatus DAOM BR117]
MNLILATILAAIIAYFWLSTTSTAPAESSLPIKASTAKKRKKTKKPKDAKSSEQKQKDPEKTIVASLVPTPPAPTPTPVTTPHTPDMPQDTDEPIPTSRVLLVKRSDPDLVASEVEEGWEMVAVPSKKKASKTENHVPIASQDPTKLTKKQRENLRKAARIKESKQALQEEQESRLKGYRREQENAWLKREIAKDQQKRSKQVRTEWEGQGIW